MEKIRFRVWDEIGRHMYYPEEANFCVTMIGSVCDDETDDGGILENRSYRMKAFLSTGRRDKVGQEIYKGDVVTFKDFTSSIVAEVIWNDEGRWDYRPKDWVVAYPAAMVRGEQVIGNIYENPTLLP